MSRRTRATSPCCYDTIVSESRIASYIGIAKGELPAKEYFGAWRTFPDSCDWSWQETKPVGFNATYLGVKVFEGAYPYEDFRVVPGWGGSMFEALMPALFVPEEEWAPRSWAVNHPLTITAQIHHGLVDAEYGYWGFSPANIPEGGYTVYGVDAIGMNPEGYPSNNDNTFVNRGFEGCPGREPQPDPAPSAYTNGVVTPHAAFLALRWAPDAVMENLANLEADFDIYDQWGFRDSVNVDTGDGVRRVPVARPGDRHGRHRERPCRRHPARRFRDQAGARRPAAGDRHGAVQRRPAERHRLRPRAVTETQRRAANPRIAWFETLGAQTERDRPAPDVALPPPDEVRAERGRGQVTIRWTPVEGAAGYLVCRADRGGELVPIDHGGGDVLAVPHGPYVDTTGDLDAATAYAVASLATIDAPVGEASSPAAPVPLPRKRARTCRDPGRRGRRRRPGRPAVATVHRLGAPRAAARRAGAGQPAGR